MGKLSKNEDKRVITPGSMLIFVAAFVLLLVSLILLPSAFGQNEKINLYDNKIQAQTFEIANDSFSNASNNYSSNEDITTEDEGYIYPQLIRVN